MAWHGMLPSMQRYLCRFGRFWLFFYKQRKQHDQNSERYKDKAPDNTAPPYPAGEDPAAQLGQRVKILGCHTVSTSTPIVSIPNRIVNSGHAGHDTLKGSVNMRVPFHLREEQQYELGDVVAFFKNAKASLPNKPGLPDFDVCLACLYYAKAMADDTFMETDSQCALCFTEYCWVPSS